MLKKIILFLFCFFFITQGFCNPLFRRLSDVVERKLFNKRVDRCRANLIKSVYDEKIEKDEEEIYYRRKCPSLTSSYVDSEPKQKEKKENVYIEQLAKYFFGLLIVVDEDKFNEILTVKDCLLSTQYFLLNNNAEYARLYLKSLLDGIKCYSIEEQFSDLNSKTIADLLYDFLFNLDNKLFLGEALKHNLFVELFWK